MEARGVKRLSALFLAHPSQKREGGVPAHRLLPRFEGKGCTPDVEQ
jgi:hypothetical protein